MDMACTIVVDGFFGDGGKGKIVSYLAVADDVSVCARGGVGPNAGHTVVDDGVTFKLRMVPCAFVNHQSKLLIGAGVVINPELVLKEATFLAATRPGYDLKKLEETLPQAEKDRHDTDPRVLVMEIPALAISSTDIRNRVKQGRPITYLVPEGVSEFIEKSGFYR